MLFSPEAHEVLTDEPWNAERARAAIASIVADTESAFDDGWSTHPQDVVEDDNASTRFRTVYCGGAGVVDALHRLARRGFVELRRDYVPYLERSLEAQPDFPDADSERSLWGGETGIRLVLQRLAPSQANLERLSELAAARVRTAPLNDQTVEGMRHKTLPIFSVQHHPEASPGPHDSRYLFGRFVEMMENYR